MEPTVRLLLELGLLLGALSVLGGLARRIGFSPVPLYLLGGLALGEGGLLPLPGAEPFIEGAASIGVVLLLLTLGLEFSVTEFSHTLRRHVPSGLFDLVLNATPGAVAGWLLGLDLTGVVALAGATYVSSSGIISRLLVDLGRLGNRETPAVLSVLVLEDFAMAAYLPLLAVLASGGTWWQALAGVALAVAALTVAFTASYRWGHRVGRVLSHPDPEQLLLRVLALTLVVAGLAELVHVSAAVGAFLVGLTLTGETAVRAGEVMAPLRDFFAAVFFVAIGLAIDPGDLLPALPVALALAAVTIVTKFVTGAYAAGRDGAQAPGRARAGAVLVIRGEFSLIIIGLAGVAQGRLGGVVAAYVIVLAVVGPVLARYADRVPGWTLSRAGR
ncbi:cation:proton antiporter [Nocardioides terrigena]|uniref:cation:proton antiporter n=1 Tax=Nocardioides terrigena TaxID=424797 RepID=UPI000D306B2C|nr:cation:proton antiporter [Nocardioides terrigena]